MCSSRTVAAPCSKRVGEIPTKGEENPASESVGVNVARTIRKSARNISHLKQNSNGKMSQKKDTKTVGYDSLKREVSKESRMIEL